MYRSTADGRFLFVNPALVAMLGYASAEELLAIDIATQLYVDPDERAPLVQRYLSLGVVDGVEVSWRRKDGELLIVRVYGHAVAGEDAGFDVTVIDVTALRAAESLLRAQRAETQQTLVQLRQLMAQLPALVWTTDRDLRFTSIEGTGGYGQFEGGIQRVIGVRVPDLFGGETHKAALHHREALAGANVHYELDHDDKLFLVSVAPKRDGDGAISGVIGTAVDVTMMRRVEKQLAVTQRIESLGVLAGGVAHDFNNLLVAMLGNADLALRELTADHTARRAVESIRTASLRASELTNQLLAYSGRGQLAVSTIDVAPLVDEMVGLLAPGRVGQLALDLAADLPPVRADSAQIRQVVMNLVTNAYDSLGPNGGQVRVRARLVEVGADPHPLDVITPSAGTYVGVEVGDTGGGMDTSTRRKIFDPFFTTKASGHGLGLAAVLGIVRGHHGGLRLFSEPGAGSVFEVLLPVGGTSTQGAQPSVTSARTGKTVLVVDDEEMVREVLCNMIQDLGYNAVGANGGGEALALVDDRGEIDAAIVDLTMPRMNGRAVVAGLRARRPALPVILTSGFDRDRATAEDVAGFLRKPFRFETLEELLGQVLGPP